MRIDRDFVPVLGYSKGISDFLEQAVATARDLPPDIQDDIARVMMMYAGEDQPAFHLTAEEASFALSRAQAARREFASDEQVRAIWSKHGL